MSGGDRKFPTEPPRLPPEDKATAEVAYERRAAPLPVEPHGSPPDKATVEVAYERVAAPRLEPLEEDPEQTAEVEYDRSAPVPALPAPRTPWWRRYPQEGVSQNASSHFARAMAYEVAVVVYTAVLVAVLAFVSFGGQTQDLYLFARSGAPLSDEVTLLGIGEEALYLWDADDPTPDATPRALLAELVRFLDAAGARVVVLDLYLDRPDAGDEALTAAAAAHGAVVVAERFVVSEPGTGLEFVRGTVPGLADHVAAGFANLQEEAPMPYADERIVRKAPLVRRVSRARLSGSWPENLLGAEQDTATVMPSMALLAAWLHRAREQDGEVRADALQAALKEVCTGTPLSCAPPELGLPPLPQDLVEPLPINFRGPEGADGLPVVRAADVLRALGQTAILDRMGVEAPIEVPPALREALADRVVVVGRLDRVGEGGADRFVTPYALPLLARADMAGPRIQAHVIDTLLSGRHIRPVPPTITLLLALGLAVAVLATWRRMPDALHTAVWFVTGCLLLVLGAALFRLTDGLSLDLGLPLLATLGTLTAVHVRGWSLEESTR